MGDNGGQEYTENLEDTVLYRKDSNTGEFKGLAEVMQLRNVERVAKKAGIGLQGIKVKIIRDESLIGRGVFGWTSPDGKMIYLYPDAFTNTESLVKTLGHERIHAYQVNMLERQALKLYETMKMVPISLKRLGGIITIKIDRKVVICLIDGFIL